MPIIKTVDLTYIYNPKTPFEKKAVDSINLEIEKGELIGVIGHTGSGKSTLIQLFNGLLQPTSGKVFIDGEDIWEDRSKLRDIRFKVGLVFQYPEHQLFEETVRKDIAYGPNNIGLDKDEVDYRVEMAAKFVGLEPSLLDKSPFELSGGQKRRAAIAGVIAIDPGVLILDEPTAGLDPKGRDKILGQIAEYQAAKKNTVLLVSHNMDEIAKYCSKVIVMNESKLYIYASVKEVFGRAEELIKIGLTVPSVTRIFLSLHNRGFDLNPYVYTLQQARDEIIRLCNPTDKGVGV